MFLYVLGSGGGGYVGHFLCASSHDPHPPLDVAIYGKAQRGTAACQSGTGILRMKWLSQ